MSDEIIGWRQYPSRIACWYPKNEGGVHTYTVKINNVADLYYTRILVWHRDNPLEPYIFNQTYYSSNKTLQASEILAIEAETSVSYKVLKEGLELIGWSVYES